MAGRLETSIWNLTFVAAAAACGPTIPIDDDGEGSFDDSGSDSATDDSPMTTPCVTGECDPPECYTSADCNASEYCYDGRCVYEPYCGIAGDDDDFRCSPWPYYDCYSDVECGPDEQCLFYECVPLEDCDPAAAYQGAYFITAPDDGPIVDLAFVDQDGAAPQELAIATSTRVVLASSFSPALTQIAVGEDFVSIAAGDVDGDGDQDLVIAERGQGGQLVVLTNDAGAISPLATIASPGVPIEVVLGDPENDGTVDAFVRTESGVVRHIDLGPQSPLVATPVSAMALAGWSLAFASEGQSWWLPVATLEPTAPTVFNAVAMQSFATARIDADVDEDVIGVVDEDGTTDVFAWRGPIGEPHAQVVLAGSYPLATAADVNGDGLSEIVVAGLGQAVVLSSGTDVFGCQSAVPFDHAALLVAAGDWDGDIGEEVVVSDGNQLTLLDHD